MNTFGSFHQLEGHEQGIHQSQGWRSDSRDELENRAARVQPSSNDDKLHSFIPPGQQPLEPQDSNVDPRLRQAIVFDGLGSGFDYARYPSMPPTSLQFPSDPFASQTAAPGTSGSANQNIGGSTDGQHDPVVGRGENPNVPNAEPVWTADALGFVAEQLLKSLSREPSSPPVQGASPPAPAHRDTAAAVDANTVVRTGNKGKGKGAREKKGRSKKLDHPAVSRSKDEPPMIRHWQFINSGPPSQMIPAANMQPSSSLLMLPSFYPRPTASYSSLEQYHNPQANMQPSSSLLLLPPSYPQPAASYPALEQYHNPQAPITSGSSSSQGGAVRTARKNSRRVPSHIRSKSTATAPVPNTDDGQWVCHWNGCGDVFSSFAELRKHLLVLPKKPVLKKGSSREKVEEQTTVEEIVDSKHARFLRGNSKKIETKCLWGDCTDSIHMLVIGWLDFRLTVVRNLTKCHEYRAPAHSLFAIKIEVFQRKPEIQQVEREAFQRLFKWYIHAEGLENIGYKYKAPKTRERPALQAARRLSQSR
ncbi:hypothetical protein M413DRAFT_412172 [Hebeloma cylindrosporum]|uniref:Uncharacterized protein n=1 Tax=Hebeloma cylindrosporum TaxID=76867 RepID=A0A0C3CBZ8_HEBCY|nr:hypothetical protein M413DRAFT_412172 [Hebeloma cylindrosporum h7]